MREKSFRGKSFLVLIFALLVIFGMTIYRGGGFIEQKIETRGAMDIGSGTTNMKIARVDPKQEKIIQLLFEQRVAVPFQKSLELSKEKIFDEKIRQQGIEALKQLKNTADNYHVKKIVAVATAAFREAKNADQYAKEIQEQTGIDVRIVPHDEEGHIAFMGAIASTGVDPQKVIVWDIGGGSFQLTTYDDQGNLHVVKGTKASIPFKNYIVQEIQKKDISEVSSPNPMTLEEIGQAIQYSESIAKELEPLLKQKIDRQGVEILGVGNLFYYGIRPIVGDKTEFTREDLKKAVMDMANKSDEDLGGDSFAEVKISNALLVLGFMNTLNIERIILVNINNADGALVYPQFWN